MGSAVGPALFFEEILMENILFALLWLVIIYASLRMFNRYDGYAEAAAADKNMPGFLYGAIWCVISAAAFMLSLGKLAGCIKLWI